MNKIIIHGNYNKIIKFRIYKEMGLEKNLWFEEN